MCVPNEAITLKTYLTDYLNQTQNFKIGRSSADDRPIVGQLPLSRATIGRRSAETSADDMGLIQI